MSETSIVANRPYVDFLKKNESYVKEILAEFFPKAYTLDKAQSDKRIYILMDKATMQLEISYTESKEKITVLDYPVRFFEHSQYTLEKFYNVNNITVEKELKLQIKLLIERWGKLDDLYKEMLESLYDLSDLLG
jgi:hypothetical protein